MKEVGNLLKQTRESQGVTIEQSSSALKVRPEYLEILESGDVSSVLNEIYILGYLKSYATWLGLNSNEIANQFKSVSKDLCVTKNAAADSSVFISIDERLPSSHRPVYLLCALLLCTFFFVNGIIDKEVPLAYDTIIEKYDFSEHPYAGFSFNKEVNDKIILMAKGDLDIKFNYGDGHIEKKHLGSGEVLFLSSDKDVLVSSGQPGYVDVFSDDEQGRYLGTLRDFYIFN